MKEWININEELSPLGQTVKFKYYNNPYVKYIKLYKDYRGTEEELRWKISDVNMDIYIHHRSYYSIRAEDMGNGLWEREIPEHELIKNRWEILDL